MVSDAWRGYLHVLVDRFGTKCDKRNRGLNSYSTPQYAFQCGKTCAYQHQSYLSGISVWRFDRGSYVLQSIYAHQGEIPHGVPYVGKNCAIYPMEMESQWDICFYVPFSLSCWVCFLAFNNIFGMCEVNMLFFITLYIYNVTFHS